VIGQSALAFCGNSGCQKLSVFVNHYVYSFSDLVVENMVDTDGRNCK